MFSGSRLLTLPFWKLSDVSLFLLHVYSIFLFVLFLIWNKIILLMFFSPFSRRFIIIRRSYVAKGSKYSCRCVAAT